MLDRLGISKEIKPKTIYAKPGPDVGDIVASGKAELGVNQLQVIMPIAGIKVAGPLPGDLQATTVFSSAIMKGTKNAAPANDLVKFLRRAIDPNPRRRFPDADRMLAAFRRIKRRCLLYAAEARRRTGRSRVTPGSNGSGSR